LLLHIYPLCFGENIFFSRIYKRSVLQAYHLSWLSTSMIAASALAPESDISSDIKGDKRHGFSFPLGPLR